MAEETQQEKTKRELLAEKIRNRHADKKLESDDDLAGQISDDYDEYDSELSGYKERENKFSELFSGNPYSAQFLIDWRDGKDPAVELIRRYGKTDLMDAINDPEKLDAIAAANKEFVDKVAKEKSLEEQYSKNLNESLKMIASLSKEGYSDEQIDTAMDALVKMASEAVMGQFTKESVVMALKAINHDVDVSAASEEGEVRGKNAKIVEKLRKKEKGDGVAALDGANNEPKEPRERRLNMFDIARLAR